MDKFSRYMWLVPGAMCIICGLVLLFNPGAMAAGICRIIGIVALITGIVEFLNEHNGAYRRSASARTILCIVSGAVLLFMPGLVLRSISLAAGLIIAAYAVTQILAALDARKLGRANWALALIIPVALLILGIIMINGGISVANLAIRIIGVVLAVYGLRMLASAAPRH
ncbi:MAG: DUF308 domain-containing protein [Clostridia bacterium]|nr:DUF308 domain-containing protein [Clostridia bacterium]